MIYRSAQISDLDIIMDIASDAKRFLKDNGVNQWQSGYPYRESFEQDIQNGNCLVFIEEDRIVGIISLVFQYEQYYEVIYEGNWLTEGTPYAVIHRAAVSSNCRGKGICSEMISYMENIARDAGVNSIRIDTHRDNKPMRHLLEKLGYTYCGVVQVLVPANGDTARVCYEKILEE